MDKTQNGKSKKVAVLLAIFLGFWSWLYTSRFDLWKFCVSLGGLTTVTIVGLGRLQLPVLVFWLLTNVLAFISQVKRNRSFFKDYYFNPIVKPSTRAIVLGLIFILVIIGSFVAWQVRISRIQIHTINSILEQSQPLDYEKAVPAGRSGRVNSFEFQVDSLECGRETVTLTSRAGISYIIEPQRGEFCVLTWRAINVTSRTSKTPSPWGHQRLIGSQVSSATDRPTVYGSAGIVIAILEPVSAGCPKTIEPGGSAICRSYFDIPIDERIVYVSLGGYSTEDGVLIKVDGRAH